MLPLLLSASVKEVTSSLSTDPFSTLSSSPFTAFHAFLAFTVLVWLFESYLDLRQRACYSVATPPPQLSWVTPSEFALAQAYGRDKILYNLVKSSFDTLKLLTLLLLSVYPALWRLSAYLLSSLRLSPSSYPLLHSLLFFSLEQTLDQLTSLPFSYYKTFTLEQLHGFNKSTRALFFSDQAKTFALLLVIGLPILALLLTVIDSAGPHFYVYCWAAVLVIQLLALTVYPVLIQPLFNRVEPLEQGSLRSAIEALAARVHFPLTRLYRIDGSKRSSHSNAYFYGFFSNKRIVIFDTLINQSSQEEVVAVLAHEIGHWRQNHTAKNLLVAQVQTFVLFWLFGQALQRPSLALDFGFSSSSTYISLLIFQFLYSPIAHLTSFLMNVLSRRFEYEADRYAVHLGYGKQLQSGLIGLHKNNKGTMISDQLYSAYHHSHPPVLDRLKAIDAQKHE